MLESILHAPAYLVCGSIIIAGLVLAIILALAINWAINKYVDWYDLKKAKAWVEIEILRAKIAEDREKEKNAR